MSSAGILQKLFSEGVVALSASRWDEAVHRFESILKYAPGHLDTLKNLSLALEGRGDLGASVSVWDRYLNNHPADTAGLISRASAYIRQGEHGLAQEDLRLAASGTAEMLWSDAKVLIGLMQMAGANIEAAGLCERMLLAEPENLELLCVMSGLANRLGDYQLSELVAHKALTLAPLNEAAALAQGNALLKLDRFDEAMECFRGLVDKNPMSLEGWQAIGLLESQLMRHERALACFDRALAISPDHHLTRFNRSLSLLALGDYLNGFRGYDARFSAHVSGVRLVKGLLPSLQWGGSDPAGKRVLVLHEQGLGDSLQFIRFVRGLKARGAQVLVRVPPPLLRLFSSVPGVDAVFSDAEPVPPHDAFVYMMSLPARLGVRQAFAQDLLPDPYLATDSQDVSAWAERLRPLSGLRVGLVWSGAPRKGFADAVYVDQRRSFRLEALLPLAQVPGVSFVSVQKGDAAQEVRSLADQWPILDLTDRLHDFADTAALLAKLDMLITVDTSVAHLAGGMGVPVWVLNRFDSDWRWLVGREDTPWYPSMRLFNQRQMGDWVEVVERVVFALRERTGVLGGGGHARDD